MKSKKYHLALAILSFAVLSSNGLQAQDRHEFSVHGAGGLSTLHYKPTLGKQKEGFGGAVGLGYTFFFNEHWGIGTGVEAALFQAKTSIDGFKLTNPTGTLPTDVAVNLKHYKEKQRMVSVNVPLMLKYQSAGTHKFYAAVGGKVGFPVSEKYKVSGVEYDVSGIDPRINRAGMATYEGENLEGDLDFKTAYFASAELGMKWKLAEGMALYTGVYADYGLNNIDNNSKSAKMLAYNGSTAVKSNSVLASNIAESAVTTKVRPIAAGLKIALAFGAGKINKAPEVVAFVPQTRPTVDYEAERRAAAERDAAEKARQAEQARLQRERDAAAQAAKQKEVEYVQAKKDVAFTLHNFQLGKSAITPEIKKTLDKSIGILKQYPEMKITTTGYTCDKGTSAVNAKVSRQRAESIKDYMVKSGISANRITTKADGEKNPYAPNTSEANRKLNRRVEVVAYE